VRTLGVDLSSQPTKTAAYMIELEIDSARVSTLRIALDDEELLGLAVQLDRNPEHEIAGTVDIDAPFGSP
jgi:hypothetical protein